MLFGNRKQLRKDFLWIAVLIRCQRTPLIQISSDAKTDDIFLG